MPSMASQKPISIKRRSPSSAGFRRRSRGTCPRPRSSKQRMNSSVPWMPKSKVMPSADRGSVWIVDLGLAAKVRPCLILSVPTDPQDRVLVTVVTHTTSVQGTRFEVDVKAPFLKPGVLDAQQIVTVPQVKLVRKLGDLTASELARVEEAVRRWLRL